ncbi:hypothetical protein, partial [Petrachloros mirabilis]
IVSVGGFLHFLQASRHERQQKRRFTLTLWVNNRSGFGVDAGKWREKARLLVGLAVVQIAIYI